MMNDKSQKGALPLCDLLKQKDLMINLVVMTFIWMIVVYNVTLTNFLFNTFENVYLSAVAGNIGTCIGYAIGGWFLHKMKTKGSLGLSFILSTIGGVLILVFGLSR